jgi:hypothetical protein
VSPALEPEISAAGPERFDPAIDRFLAKLTPTATHDHS